MDNDNEPILLRHKPATHYRITATLPNGMKITRHRSGIVAAHRTIKFFAAQGYQFKAEIV